MSIEITTRIELLHCANCGLQFGMTSDFEERRRNDHGNFYCPAGHSNVYLGKSKAERLQDQLNTKERELAAEIERRRRAEHQVEAEQFKTRAERAAKTRLQNRIGHGVCPCCQRTFKQLAAHMKAKHPNFSQTPTTTKKTKQ